MKVYEEYAEPKLDRFYSDENAAEDRAREIAFVEEREVIE